VIRSVSALLADPACPPPPRLLEVAAELASLEGRPWCVCRDEDGLHVAVEWEYATEAQRAGGIRVEGTP
jgi:hypothetical protein